jgi:enoyl-CoA hydratase
MEHNMFENIKTEKKGKTGILTIDRQKALNALNPATLNEIETALCGFRDDPEVGIIIITGAGEKAFIAGADISAMVDMTPLQAKEFAELGHRVLKFIEELPKVVIAAVNGFALGGGCELAMACDMIFASKKAKLGQPEVNLGIIPGFGGTQRLARLVGRNKAKEIVMTADMIPAEEAWRIGLVNAVFEDAEFMDRVITVAEKILKKGPLAISMAKKAINEGLEIPLPSANKMEILDFAILMSTSDQKEGMKAFLEKREAKFTGK